jgi:uncharacterized protein (TIGR03000 family)
MIMLHRLVHLSLVGAALFLFADGADARHGRGGCGGGGCGGGGCYGGGCYGGGCYGGGCFVGGGGCYGGICVLPGTPATGGGTSNGGMKKNGEDKDKDKDVAAPANLRVNLPADAKLFVDGAPTRSTSSQRLLITPNLQPGREFHYTLRAEVVRDGQVQRVSQRVAVRAGRETQVTIQVPTAVAAR